MEKDIIEKITAIEETLKYHTKMLESLAFEFDNLFKSGKKNEDSIRNISDTIKENPLFKDNPHISDIFNSIMGSVLSEMPSGNVEKEK